LRSAVYKGDNPAVKELLDKGADVNENFQGETLLVVASIAGHLDTVKLLLDRGASVNASAGGRTALFYAATQGHTAMVKLLLDRGADLNTAIAALNRGGRGDAVAFLTGFQPKIAGQPVIAGPPAEISAGPAAVKSDIDELPAAPLPVNKHAYAIVIGIEQYRQKLPRADYAASDARLMNQYLTRAMGYPEENVVILLNDKALQSDLTKYFERWLGNNVDKDSTVFIYYSGHGAPNPATGDAFLVPYDGDPSFIAETGYSLRRLYEALGKLPAKEIIVTLDSCFSGAGGRSVLAKGARPLVLNTPTSTLPPRNMTILAASTGGQISSTYDEKGHGLFTYFLLKGIKNENVVKADGAIDLKDLFGYLKPQVERVARKQYNNEQTPQLLGARPN
jgi:hypothetical protein